MSALTKYAKSKPCMIRIPAICTGRDEETVACHVPLMFYHGTGFKMLDWFIAFGCRPCHAEVDRKTQNIATDKARIYLLEGMIRTQEYIIEKAPHLLQELITT